ILAFSAITNNDKVGVIFFSSEVEKFIPPKKGKTHILRIISEIYDFHPMHAGTNMAEALKYLNNVVKKKCITFLISDFMNPATENGNGKELKNSVNIVARKHDLIGLHIYDEREVNLPNIGLVKVADAETGKEFWIDTSKRSLREKYTKDFRENLRFVKDLFGKSGAQLESIKTEDSYVIALMNMFKQREMRR
ncbi:MAG: VWA domain-containing protein, partial [Chitinophagales bacterium]